MPQNYNFLNTSESLEYEEKIPSNTLKFIITLQYRPALKLIEPKNDVCKFVGNQFHRFFLRIQFLAYFNIVILSLLLTEFVQCTSLKTARYLTCYYN
jgi:hypothetical protein